MFITNNILSQCDIKIANKSFFGYTKLSGNVTSAIYKIFVELIELYLKGDWQYASWFQILY